MGDVLVYLEPSGGERVLAWARPLADAAGGALVALVAGDGPVDQGALAAADVVLEVSHPALSPYTPEAHRAVLGAAISARTPDLVVLENTTAGLDLAAASAATAGLAFVGYCVELTLEGGEAQSVSDIYGGQLLATARTPLPAVVAQTITSPCLAASGLGRRQKTIICPSEQHSRNHPVGRTSRSAFLLPGGAVENRRDSLRIWAPGFS